MLHPLNKIISKFGMLWLFILVCIERLRNLTKIWLFYKIWKPSAIGQKKYSFTVHDSLNNTLNLHFKVNNFVDNVQNSLVICTIFNRMLRNGPKYFHQTKAKICNSGGINTQLSIRVRLRVKLCPLITVNTQNLRLKKKEVWYCISCTSERHGPTFLKAF